LKREGGDGGGKGGKKEGGVINKATMIKRDGCGEEVGGEGGIGKMVEGGSTKGGRKEGERGKVSKEKVTR